MIYPPVCGFCGKLDKNSLCNKCKIRIQKNAICKIEDYRETTSFFDEHIYLFQYDGEIRDAILNFKFNLLRSIINESTIDGLKDYKGCLDNNDVSYKQKIEKTNLINNMNQYVSERFSLHLMLQWTILILVV